MTAKKILSLFYVGNDKVFLEDLKEFNSEFWFAEKDNIETSLHHAKVEKDWIEDIFNKVVKYTPNIIYIDFSDQYDQFIKGNRLENYLKAIKKNPQIKSTPICFLFLTEEQLNENRYLFAYGMNYAFVKGESYRALFEDSYYLAFEDKIAFPKYAIARNLNLKHKIDFPISVKKIDSSIITIESDLLFEEEDIMSVDFSFFEDFNGKEFTVSRCDEVGPLSLFLNSIALRINYADPWDEITEDSMLKETVETWIDLNREKFKMSGPPFVLINNNVSDIPKIINHLENVDDYILFNYNLEEKFSYIRYERPALIMINLDEDDDQDYQKGCLPNTTESAGQLIEFIKSIDYYDPAVVLFNSNSKSEALRKAFFYERVIANNKNMNINDVSSLVEMFKKKTSNVHHGELYLPIHSPKSIGDIKLEVTITSLTEHELTFLSEMRLPYYSILKIDQPFDMYLVIVPPIKELEGVRDKFHYMAFIHGMSEKSLPVVRKFINQLIYKVPDEFIYNPDLEIEEEKISEGKIDEYIDDVKKDRKPVKIEDNKLKVKRNLKDSEKSKL